MTDTSNITDSTTAQDFGDEIEALDRMEQVTCLGPDEVQAIEPGETDWFQMWLTANTLAVRLIHERDAVKNENRLLRAIFGVPDDQKITE